MFHLGVDAWNLLGDRRGIGRYARALIREWSTTFASEVELTLLVPQSPAWWYAARYQRETAGRKLRVRNRGAAARARCDALWFPWNGLSWSAPGPKVAVLHDASLFALPIPPAVRDRELRPFRRAVAEGAHIITDSHDSKRQLMGYLHLPAASIDVVHLGVDMPPEEPARRASTSEFGQRFILFVGEFEERKGLDVLSGAFALLPEKLRSETALVLAGETRGIKPPVPSDSAFVLGHVSDAKLAQLYRDAAAFVFPSRYEGFGLPVLEAMARGAPVIASDAASVVEAGGDAARYFQNGNASDLALAIAEILCNPGLAEDLRRRGKQRAKAMPWATTARRTLEIIARQSRRSV